MNTGNKNAAVAAIQFALETDDGLEFLRRWNWGDFDVIRREWPEAPEEVYIGADPLHLKTANAPSEAKEGVLSAETIYALADEHSNGRVSGSGAYLFKPFSLTLFAEAIQAVSKVEEKHASQ